jgi:ribosome-binding factor A
MRPTTITAASRIGEGRTMSKKRAPRLNEQLKRELTQLLQFEVRDPRIGMVTVTAVEVSPDLYHAKVYYTMLGEEEERRSAHEGLRAAAGFLRTEIGRRMRIRRAPELHFSFDASLDYAMHIERLLREARATTPGMMDDESRRPDADGGSEAADGPDAGESDPGGAPDAAGAPDERE